MSKLTAAQQDVLRAVAAAGEPVCAYKLHTPLATLQALQRLGRVYCTNAGALGSGFSPRTVLKWLARVRSTCYQIGPHGPHAWDKGDARLWCPGLQNN